MADDLEWFNEYSIYFIKIWSSQNDRDGFKLFEELFPFIKLEKVTQIIY